MPKRSRSVLEERSTRKVRLTPVYNDDSSSSFTPSTILHLPLSLGRKNLCLLWWDSCPNKCKSGTKRCLHPCRQNCRSLCKRTNLDQISKQVLQIQPNGTVDILAKNKRLTHWTGNILEGPCRIRIGPFLDPWVVFDIELIRAVTPESKSPKRRETDELLETQPILRRSRIEKDDEMGGIEGETFRRGNNKANSMVDNSERETLNQTRTELFPADERKSSHTMEESGHSGANSEGSAHQDGISSLSLGQQEAQHANEPPLAQSFDSLRDDDYPTPLTQEENFDDGKVDAAINLNTGLQNSVLTQESDGYPTPLTQEENFDDGKAGAASNQNVGLQNSVLTHELSMPMPGDESYHSQSQSQSTTPDDFPVPVQVAFRLCTDLSMDEWSRVASEQDGFARDLARNVLNRNLISAARISLPPLLDPNCRIKL